MAKRFTLFPGVKSAKLFITSLTPVLALGLVFVLSSCGEDDPPPPPAPVEQTQDTSAIPAAPASPMVIQPLLPAKLSVRPSSLRLGPTLPGGSDSQSITISNDGEELLSITEIRLDADPAELNAAGNCLDSAPKMLGKGESCELAILFTPLQAGGEATGEIAIVPDAQIAPVFVAVSATRDIPPPAPPPVVFGPSPALENAIAMAQARRGGRMMIFENDVVPGPEDVITKDQDYTPIGFAPTISTLPVDRSRLITADKYIPAVLENTINSQLAGGRIVGVVENHVYGGDGRYVLLPAGSRAIGVYESLSRQGDTRLRASFVRVMRPDGAAIAIEGDPAADVMGRLGLIGDVDNRYFDRFAGPLLISFINAIGTVATSTDTITSTDSSGVTTSTQTLTPEEQAYQNFATDLSFISQRLVEENLNLAPIITIPGGSRFLIMPTRDIQLQGYTLIAANDGIISNEDAMTPQPVASNSQATSSQSNPPPGVSRPPAQSGQPAPRGSTSAQRSGNAQPGVAP